MDLKIGEAKEFDLEEIKKMIIENFPYTQNKINELLKRIEKDNVFVFKAETKKEIAGFIDIELTESNEGKIVAISTKKEFRNRGMAKEMMNFALEFFKANSVERISLIVGKKNLAAKNLYNKFGFRVTRELDKKINNETVEEMALSLNSLGPVIGG